MAGLQMPETITFCCFKSSDSVTLLKQPQETCSNSKESPFCSWVRTQTGALVTQTDVTWQRRSPKCGSSPSACSLEVGSQQGQQGYDGLRCKRLSQGNRRAMGNKLITCLVTYDFPLFRMHQNQQLPLGD